MTKTLSLKRNLIIFGIPLLIIGMMILLAKSSLFYSNPNQLSIGITFDLLLTVPFVYFLLIRKTNIPKTTIVPFLILGMVVGSVILPSQNQHYLNLFKTRVFPVVELSIVSFVIYKVSQAIKGYKASQNPSIDFYTTLKNTCYEILPKGAVIPVVTEIAVFYYGFIYWKKRPLKDNEYSYHKESGTIGLLVAIIGIVAIETFVLHKLLLKWSDIAAWILSFLSVYSGFQLFGFLRSIYKRPIAIENDKVFLRYGIMNETTIDIAQIDSVELTSKDIELDKKTRKLSILGSLESHNVIIRLKEENTLTGLYGIKRKYKNLALHIDNKVEFKDRITSSIQNLN
ncbi:hypothetical protein [Gaetbulibacter aestuarii]|uniref:Uncharacterized protein n=1 Tax=Gaetbulibacter aestuarii TaxID=1502358 RepID=A0ABW7MW31_9FLAO